MDVTATDRGAADARKLAFLSRMPGVTRVIETHMAHVFLTDRMAYKLKKPLRVGFSDCTTLEARQRACATEIRLNRDLAERVYLGIVPLVEGRKGLSLGGEGEGRIVDWLVQMRRLPASRMLDAMIAAGTGPSAGQVRALADCLVRFYRRQALTPPPGGLYLAHLQREQAINVAHLGELGGLLPDPASVAVAEEVAARLPAAAAEISLRERVGAVVEGHGDLRPEHLCLTDPPVVFDRVESALELRVADVFDETMYLAAECALLGRPGIGGVLAGALCAAGFAAPSPGLMRSYLLFRLVTRARLLLDHLRYPEPRSPGTWPPRAQAYLDAAALLLREGGRVADDGARPC